MKEHNLITSLQMQSKPVDQTIEPTHDAARSTSNSTALSDLEGYCELDELLPEEDRFVVQPKIPFAVTARTCGQNNVWFQSTFSSRLSWLKELGMVAELDDFDQFSLQDPKHPFQIFLCNRNPDKPFCAAKREAMADRFCRTLAELHPMLLARFEYVQLVGRDLHHNTLLKCYLPRMIFEDILPDWCHVDSQGSAHSTQLLMDPKVLRSMKNLYRGAKLTRNIKSLVNAFLIEATDRNVKTGKLQIAVGNHKWTLDSAVIAGGIEFQPKVGNVPFKARAGSRAQPTKDSLRGGWAFAMRGAQKDDCIIVVSWQRLKRDFGITEKQFSAASALIPDPIDALRACHAQNQNVTGSTACTAIEQDFDFSGE